jgi:hypothetical protein
MSSKNGDTRCKGTTKRGEPCRAAATAGGLCFFHANPNKASELGRIGGRRNRRAVIEMVDPLPVVVDEVAVRDTVARLVADVYAGKVHPKTAASLALLLNLQLRAFGALDEAEKKSMYRPYMWRRAAAKPEISKVGEAEISNAGKPESSSVAKPEISNVGRAEISNGGWPEMANAAGPEISNVGKAESLNGGWPEMADAAEPEISSVGKQENSSEEKFKSSSAGSPDLSSFVHPVLPIEEILAMNRERDRRLAIAAAQAASLSHAFGLDEL